MSSTTNPGNGTSDPWSVLTYHDWSGPEGLETSLLDALAELDGSAEDTVLYDHVDVEAIVDAVAPGTTRGVSEIRFEYDTYEIRLTQDGAIAAR